jgi:membrane fusion protein, multidrug efflux system
VRPINQWQPRSYRLAGAALAGLIILIASGWWLYRQLTHVHVNDARIAADMIAVSSRVPGWVTGVEVIEGDAVKGGMRLISIDGRQTQLRIEELDARLAGIAARREEIQARIRMIDRQTASRIEVQEAAKRAAEAALSAAIAQHDLARLENVRSEELATSEAISRARLDQTRAVLEINRQQVRSARADLENAHAALTQAKAARDELTVLERQLATLGPEEQQLRARREHTLLDLQDRTISMPFDGVVDRVFVNCGEYVTPGQRLLMVHDPERVRVEANIKETDIRYFRPGKRVAITVDALPGRRFEGIVDRIGHAATSEFALLPNPNPSGNFTKITQRLPVRIAIEQQEGRLKPGMMVVLKARARE